MISKIVKSTMSSTRVMARMIDPGTATDERRHLHILSAAPSVTSGPAVEISPQERCLGETVSLNPNVNNIASGLRLMSVSSPCHSLMVVSDPIPEIAYKRPKDPDLILRLVDAEPWAVDQLFNTRVFMCAALPSPPLAIKAVL